MVALQTCRWLNLRCFLWNTCIAEVSKVHGSFGLTPARRAIDEAYWCEGASRSMNVSDIHLVDDHGQVASCCIRMHIACPLPGTPHGVLTNLVGMSWVTDSVWTSCHSPSLGRMELCSDWVGYMLQGRLEGRLGSDQNLLDWRNGL